MEIRYRLRLEEREEYRKSLALYRKPRAALSIENRGPTLPNSESLALSIEIESLTRFLSKSRASLTF
jgi:hypothetical protein